MTRVKHKKIFCCEKMLLKLNFEVLYQRVLFVMSFVYYFGGLNRGIPRATSSNILIANLSSSVAMNVLIYLFYRGKNNNIQHIVYRYNSVLDCCIGL